MNKRFDNKDIEALLENPEHAEHPLFKPLQDLYNAYQDQLQKIERITRISDKVQLNSKLETASVIERFEKSIKKLERIAKISDRYQSILQELNTELQHASTHDHLTKVGNRQFMTWHLNAAMERPEPFSIILLDIDHFKGVNDTYGHGGGDATLIAIAQSLLSSIREGDVMARWGGEEFLILLPGAPLEVAMLSAERLRSSLEKLGIKYVDAEIKVTGSFGICEHDPNEALRQTISRADKALYKAKQQGRNSCVVANENFLN
jgi:diguanylate cyclase